MRGLGVTQKTAWFMLHRLRLAMKADNTEPFSGEIEADETYIGGTRRSLARRSDGSRKSEGPAFGKTIVMGIIERKGKVRALVVPDTKKRTLLPKVWENVMPGSTVYTDALHSYHDLKGDCVHEVINHAHEYVRGNVHTNNIENFWSVILKRTFGGTYIAPRPKHLERYLDEQMFRFNAREKTDGDRFLQVLPGAGGRRVTWKQLTRKPAES